MSASPDLLFQLTKKWHCHQIRRTHPVRRWTTEKGSLCGNVGFVDSGIVNRKAVDVGLDEDDDLYIALKNDNEADLRKPDKMWKTISLQGGVRKAIKKADSSLDMYRPAAKKYALRKVSALSRAQARRKAGVDKAKVKSGRVVN